MPIFATAVTGYGPTTVVIDNAGASHAVPPEGLPVTVLAPITLVDGQTLPTSIGGQTTVFQQPYPTAAQNVEIVDGTTDTLPAGTVQAIQGAENA